MKILTTMDKYHVVNEINIINLVASVNEYISKGYQPIGGVCVSIDGKYIYYFQSMLMTEKEN